MKDNKHVRLWLLFILLLVATNVITYKLVSQQLGADRQSEDSSHRFSEEYRASTRSNESDQRRVSRSSSKPSAINTIPAKPHTPEIHDLVDWQIMSDSGKLTTASVEAMSMTREERNKVQSVLDALWSSAAKAVAERAELDKEASDLENGKTVYFIPAAPDRGQGLLNTFQIGLVNSLGQERGTKLFKAFDPRTKYGGFGRYDVMVEFQETEVGKDMKGMPVRWKYFNPVSGNVTTTAEMTLEAFEGYFGGSFMSEKVED